MYICLRIYTSTLSLPMCLFVCACVCLKTTLLSFSPLHPDTSFFFLLIALSLSLSLFYSLCHYHLSLFICISHCLCVCLSVSLCLSIFLLLISSLCISLFVDINIFPPDYQCTLINSCIFFLQILISAYNYNKFTNFSKF